MESSVSRTCPQASLQSHYVNLYEALVSLLVFSVKASASDGRASFLGVRKNEDQAAGVARRRSPVNAGLLLPPRPPEWVRP